MNDCKIGQSKKMHPEIQMIKKQEITFRKYNVSVHPQNCILSASIFYLWKDQNCVLQTLYTKKK